MSHWRAWKIKEYQEVENKPPRVQFFDLESHSLGKTDEELLRIYYFRKPQTIKQYFQPNTNSAAKKQFQLILEQSRADTQQQDDSEVQNIEIKKSKNPSNIMKANKNTKFATSSATNSSQISNYSSNVRFS